MNRNACGSQIGNRKSAIPLIANRKSKIQNRKTLDAADPPIPGVREPNDDRPAGLYVHVPFCRSKCTYCGFYSISDLNLVSVWKNSLLREVLSYKDRFNRIETVYFGGGTPSCLNPAVIDEIITVLGGIFRIEPAAEITVEANPDDITAGLLRTLRESGVNRLSIGVQSLDDNALMILGRRHTAVQAMMAVEAGRREGFDTIGIDLIYNIPGQPLNTWMHVLETALDMRTDHVSCYELSIEPGTPLKNRMPKSGYRDGQSERDRRFFLETSRVVSDRDYEHYEVSNFALDKTRRSRHNMKYWRREPYLGLGPSAHSMRGRTRWWNRRDLGSYCRTVNSSGYGIEGRELLTDEQVTLERLFLGFRNVDGLARSLVQSDRYNAGITRALVDRGLLRVNGDRFIPTVEGYLLADSLPLEYGL